MATVAHVPRDTRFGELGAAINEALGGFLGRKRELREKAERDDMLTSLFADAQSGELTDEELVQGMLQSFPAGQEREASAFLNTLLNARANRATVGVTERGQDLGLLGTELGIESREKIAGGQTKASLDLQALRADLAREIEGSRRVGQKEVAEIQAFSRIEAARQSIFNKRIQVDLFNEAGAKKTFTVPEYIAGKGDAAIKEFITKTQGTEIPEGFSLTEPANKGIPALGLKLFDLFTENVDFENLTPEAQAQVIGTFNIFIRGLTTSGSPLQQLMREAFEKSGVITAGTERISQKLTEQRVKTKLAAGEEVKDAELKSALPAFSTDDLLELLESEKLVGSPQRDLINEELNKRLKKTVKE